MMHAFSNSLHISNKNQSSGNSWLIKFQLISKLCLLFGVICMQNSLGIIILNVPETICEPHIVHIETAIFDQPKAVLVRYFRLRTVPVCLHK